jgi:O-antigen/teichoic acid export membrane protein
VTTFRNLGANSAIYAATNLFQKGATFLLMPLYTLYLDPAAFGTLAIVTAVNGFLSIAFTLGLTGTVTRFYFEYRDDPAALAEFLGSILIFVVLFSLLAGGVLLAIGERLLRPFVGDVAFWPYVALGVTTTIFQPLFAMYLALLQTRNQAGQYALVALANFVVTTMLTVALVVFLHWGVTGVLVSTLAAAVVSFALSLYLLRSDLRLCLRWRYLHEAFAYSLPQVPHSVASQTTAMADRLILNSKLGTSSTGLYSVGAMISMVVEVIAYSVNRAYVPLSMSALKSRDPVQLMRLRVMGSLVVAGFCLLGAAVAAFGPELVRLLTAPAFSGAALVIPALVFGGVASAIYYLLVNVLFFDRNGTKLLPICTLTAAILNVALALLLIPRFSLMGAAVASLLAQVLATVMVAAIGRRFDPVAWDYGPYIAAFVSSLGFALWLSRLAEAGTIVTLALKVASLTVLAMLLGAILWRRPLILADAAVRLLRCRPDQAAALFMHTKAAT